MEYSRKLLPNGIVLHNFKVYMPHIKRKVFYQISDAHLTCFNDTSSDNEKEWATKQTLEWLKAREYVAQNHNEVFNDMSQSAEDYFKNALACVKNADALILSGDICDYVSDANICFIEDGLKKINAPIVSVCGNHEKPEQIKDGYIFSKTKEPFSVLELDDILIVGIDNSLKQITKEQNQKLKEILKLNKPIILVMHTPIKTEDTAETFDKIGNYYALNNSAQDENTKEFVEFLKQNDDKVVLVLAGHLHFKTIGHITQKLCQITASQCLTGNLFKYEVGEI